MLVTHPAGTFGTWNKLSSAFLDRLYSQWKSYGARRMIVNFNQKLGESLFKGHRRYTSLIRTCPHHDFSSSLLIHFFYGGLDNERKERLDLTTKGAFMDKTVKQR